MENNKNEEQDRMIKLNNKVIDELVTGLVKEFYKMFNVVIYKENAHDIFIKCVKRRETWLLYYI